MDASSTVERSTEEFFGEISAPNERGADAIVDTLRVGVLG